MQDSLSNLLKAFAQYEKEQGLFERTYSGQPYWAYVRFDEFRDVSNHHITDKVEKAYRNLPETSKIKSMAAAFVQAVRETVTGKRYTQADLLFIISSRGGKEDNYANRFMESFDLPPQISVCKVRNSINDYASLSPLDEHTLAWAAFRFWFLLAWHKALRKIGIRPKRDEPEFAFLQQLEQDVKAKFGHSLTAEQMEQHIRGQQEYRRAYEKQYRRLLAKVKPKAIGLVCYYSPPDNMILIELANELHIPVIEFMHGVVRDHQAYYFADRSGHNNPVPDYFLSFGKWQTQWCQFTEKTCEVEIGSPFQEAQLKKYENIQVTPKTVVFYPSMSEKYEQIIIHFAALARKRGYRVLCKIHPGQCADFAVYYPLLSKCTDVECLLDKTLNVYDCLFRYRHHVMANTTVAYEVKAIPGRDLYVPNAVAHTQSQPFIDSGAAQSFDTPEELLAQIEENERQGMTAATMNIWKPNAKQNMENFFAKMAAQGWPYPQDFKP